MRIVAAVKALAHVCRRYCATLIAPDIRFVSIWGRPDIGTPVKPAREIRPDWLKRQYTERPLKFARCPGMWDTMNSGYIVSAWCDIHIKANKQGISIRMEGANNDPGHAPALMDFSLIDGLAPIKDSVKRCVMKIPVPYAILTKLGISAQVLPATMHSPFLDKLYVYPGDVDYDKFQTINFIFSALEECEFTIWAGTPLLQVIPFKRHHFTAECGPATSRELALKKFGFFSKKPGLYRKLFHGHKKFDLLIKDNV